MMNVCTKLSNRQSCAERFPSSWLAVTLLLLWRFSRLVRVAVKTNNFKRLLLTFGALSDLSTEVTAERSFAETAEVMLTSVREALGAREGVLFIYSDKPDMLLSIAVQGYALFPSQGVIPLLPKHLHALTVASRPIAISTQSAGAYLSSNGNVAPELFRLLAPLRVGGKVVGALALGRRDEDAGYDAAELEALGMVSSYIALAVHNHALTESLEQRVSENLRLLGSIHKFYDNALEAIATAVDVKHFSLNGHSLRVGRYAAGMAEALGLPPTDVAGLKAAGYLHDIGKVAVDKALFGKPGALDAQEFREIADHTVVGHRIVHGIDFPWPRIPEVVRSHHERCDGSGYPDHVHGDEVAMPTRVVAVADAFDAMTSQRPWRDPMTAGAALTELVRLAPAKFDADAVHALIVQVRRDAVGSHTVPFLDEHVICNIGPSDIDHIAATLHHKVTSNRTYSA
jgi:putative nucleotidyltransferase with HDIG domain